MKNFGDRQRQIEEEVKEQLKSDGSTLRRPEGPVAKTALEMNQQGNNEKKTQCNRSELEKRGLIQCMYVWWEASHCSK